MDNQNAFGNFQLTQLHQKNSLRSIISTERNQRRHTCSPQQPTRNGSLRDLFDGNSQSPPRQNNMQPVTVVPPPLNYIPTNKRKYERIASNHSNLSIISLIGRMPVSQNQTQAGGSAFTVPQQPREATNILPLFVQKNSSIISGDFKVDHLIENSKLNADTMRVQTPKMTISSSPDEEKSPAPSVVNTDKPRRLSISRVQPVSKSPVSLHDKGEAIYFANDQQQQSNNNGLQSAEQEKVEPK